VAVSEEAGIVKERRVSVARRSCKEDGLQSAIVVRNGGRLGEDGRENGQQARGAGLYSGFRRRGDAMPETGTLNRMLYFTGPGLLLFIRRDSGILFQAYHKTLIAPLTVLC
jgi:hypothetical protein